MAEHLNAGFHKKETLGSALNQHAISFQPGTINSTADIIPMDNYFVANNSAGNMIFSGNSSIISNISPVAAQAGNSPGSLLFDSGSGLNHDAGLAVEWSFEEQYKLEEGLVKFADEMSIMKHIKIAGTLQNKTVRDVALRCRWMTRKRRKQEESHLGRRGTYRKDKLADPSSMANSITGMAAYSFPAHLVNQEDRQICRALIAKAKQLLELNNEAFSQISINFSSLKIQDNIDLFRRIRDNIDRVRAIMVDITGGMRQMRGVPISVDQELADSILSCTVQVLGKMSR
ncbi:hypothetical protein Nepgr_013775 [Nepenthes gracilis]|uniref:Uncharacterized protein n=1 Tax=Nepenthes gracilis TaxID=150966 RepID=A0AAD3SJI1_NEPGR|nr:hypothetical protein Nepgr_013775 [Nepenthes gracilis]